MPLPPPLLPNGITSKQSSYSVKESIDRLQKALEAKGITIFSRIDQQAEAQKVGLKLSPVEFLLFGNPRAGTPIRSSIPLPALDLPLKPIPCPNHKATMCLTYI